VKVKKQRGGPLPHTQCTREDERNQKDGPRLEEHRETLPETCDSCSTRTDVSPPLRTNFRPAVKRSTNKAIRIHTKKEGMGVEETSSARGHRGKGVRKCVGGKGNRMFRSCILTWEGKNRF